MEGQHIICVRLDGGYSSWIKCHWASDPHSVTASVTKPHSATLGGHAFGVGIQDRYQTAFIRYLQVVWQLLSGIKSKCCFYNCMFYLLLWQTYLHVKTAGFSELRDRSDFRLEEQSPETRECIHVCGKCDCMLIYKYYWRMWLWAKYLNHPKHFA